LHETNRPLQAIRFDHWKAVRNGPGQALELYDLTTDAAELKNLAAARRDLVARAETLMRAAHVDDPNWPLTGRAAARDADRAKNAKKKKG
jgi:arylsulfatase A